MKKKTKYILISVVLLTIFSLIDYYFLNGYIISNINETYKTLNPNPDTLRYFYSSVFQGFAAIFTLGAMFYIYNSDKIDTVTIRLEIKVEEMIEVFRLYDVRNKDKVYINTHGVFRYIEDKIIGDPDYNTNSSNKWCYDYLVKSLEIFKLRRTLIKVIQESLVLLVKLSIIILITSLVVLIFIQFNNTTEFNKIIFLLAWGLLILFSYYFILLYKYIHNCIGLFHAKVDGDEN